MPSPFPGMDPYIEDRDSWTDFHNNLASEIQAQLNSRIRPRYIARLIPRLVYDVIEIEAAQSRSVYPDVGIYDQATSQRRIREVAAPEMAVFALETAAPPEKETPITIPPASVYSYTPNEHPLDLMTVEIRLKKTKELITAIEILSPVNKRPGREGVDEYLRKRTELLRSPAHLMEIDLLRAGTRPPLETPVPAAPYYVTLSRVNDRPRVKVWPIQLFDPLPLLPVPLLEPDPDVPLDLGKAVAAVYERGGYADWLDYREPPPLPTLSEEETAKLEELLKSRA